MTVFTDAQAMHVAFPYSFDAPSVHQLASLKLGDNVKVCSNGERFWTKIMAVNGDEIIAEVDNLLIGDHEFNLGDKIVFKKTHVYDIMT